IDDSRINVRGGAVWRVKLLLSLVSVIHKGLARRFVVNWLKRELMYFLRIGWPMKRGRVVFGKNSSKKAFNLIVWKLILHFQRQLQRFLQRRRVGSEHLQS